MTVTFFGHRDTPEKAEKNLLTVLIDLIENKKANRFLVGHNGSFDGMVKRLLTNLKKSYPHISVLTVLAYLPEKDPYSLLNEKTETVYPEGLEAAPRRFAICKRNEWMVKESDIVITYVKGTSGGAARYKEFARRKQKQIIEISES